MADKEKTKEQLMRELADLRQRITELEKRETKLKKEEEEEEEEELRANKERFQKIIENSPVAYYKVGKDGLWQYVNPAWERMHGYSLEEVIGKPFEITQTKDDVEKAREYVQRSLAGETIVGEFSRLTKEGKVGYHTFNIQPVKKGAEIVAIEGFINDITERKQMEEALGKSEKLYRLLAENVADLIWTVDMDVRFTYVSPSSTRLFGYTPEEMMGQAAVKFLPPDSVGLVSETLAKELAIEASGSGDPSRTRVLELQHMCKDGPVIWVDVKMTFLRGPDGQPVGILGVSRDITERRKAEEALRGSEEQYRYLYESSKDGLKTCDMTGRIINANKAYLDMLGFTEKEIRTKKYQDLTPSKWHKPEDDIIRDQVFKRGFSEEYEKENIRKDGTIIPISVRTYLLKDKDGNPIGTWALVRDMTEHKQIEQAKNNLIRDMSHSIKSPIAVAEMGYNMWKKGTERNRREDIKNGQEIVYDSIRTIRKDIGNMVEAFTLDMRKTESKKKKKNSLKTIVNETVKDVKDLVEQKKLKIMIDIPRGSDRIPAEKRDLRVLIGNIVDNAVNFTERGRISISSRLKGKWMEIRIKDTGCGISAEDRDRVFERFYKRDAAGEGTGLGLTICKEIVEMYGGEIRAVSKGTGKGTAVIVRLPV